VTAQSRSHISFVAQRNAVSIPANRRSESEPMRVGLFNVKYSPNLGDGVLCECLEAEMRRWAPDSAFQSFDLAGRTAYADGGRFRAAALALLHHSPLPVRHGVAEALLGYSLRRHMRPKWRSELEKFDAVVVGGGNLFSDTDLNFPLKIDAAMAEVRAAGLPAAVFGVGVSNNWSSRGEALFRRALGGDSLVYASVRESRSAEIWNRRLRPAGVASAAVVHDPGVLVADYVPKRRSSDDGRPLVGLGLTHPMALRYHADEVSANDLRLTAWYRQLLRSCLERGWRVAVFTNGSAEDDAYLRQTAPAFAEQDHDGRVAIVPRFRLPEEFARFIAGLDLLMAHRLHANITAYSYGIPQVGFSWDAKLKSFLASVGRGDSICTAGVDSVAKAMSIATRELHAGVDPVRRLEVLAQARLDVSKLVEALRRAVGAARRAKRNIASGSAAT
jgi:polysaccharide pyruvyl transferase WcaK-like protein